LAIHPTATVASSCVLGKEVEVGPFCVLEGECRIGARTRIGPHVHVLGFTTIGEECRIHAGAVVGDDPQDLSFDGKPSEAIVGARCVLREGVTIHRGTKEGTRTVVGDDCYLMAYAHVAHNCRVGNRVIIVNNSALGGYVEVDDRAFLSAGVYVHQFCRIGTLAFVGPATTVRQDVPPYAMSDGHPLLVHGTNVTGLRRAGMDEETRRRIKEAFRILYRTPLSRDEALAEIERRFPGAESSTLAAFVRASKRGICPHV
jgi:UDP-N-acetylglucosamine acyltransferase